PGQPPDQECIYIAKEHISAFGSRAHTRDIIENPFDLRTGKVRVSHQTRALADLLVKPFSLQSIANRNRQTTLPDDGIKNGFTSMLIPDNSRLALIGNPNGRDIGRT